LVCALVLVSCSSRNSVFDGGDDNPGDATTGDENMFNNGDGGDASTGQRGCSSDLQTVVDGNGNAVMQCPPDQGCSGGQCVPACQAAADAKGSLGCRYVVSTPS